MKMNWSMNRSIQKWVGNKEQTTPIILARERKELSHSS